MRVEVTPHAGRDSTHRIYLVAGMAQGQLLVERARSVFCEQLLPRQPTADDNTCLHAAAAAAAATAAAATAAAADASGDGLLDVRDDVGSVVVVAAAAAAAAADAVVAIVAVVTAAIDEAPED